MNKSFKHFSAAFVVVPALLSAGPAAAAQPAVLSFHYTVGQTLKYRMEGVTISSMGHRHSGSSEVTLAITSHDGTGYHATQTLKHNDGQMRTHQLVISDEGVWRDEQNGNILDNNVSFDPRTLCVSGPLTVNAKWTCSVPGDYVRPAGVETVTVKDVQSDRVTFDVTGDSGIRRDDQMDAQTHTPVNIRTRMTWHDSLTFSRGRLVQSSYTEVHKTDFVGTDVHGVTTVHGVVTAE